MTSILLLAVPAPSPPVTGGEAEVPVLQAEEGSPAPIVFIVLDEFPVASLMDGNGDIQEHLYPTFTRLTRDGTWYRNAVTVRHLTLTSLPTILTGVGTSRRKIPLLSVHPQNLFTLLDDTHEVHATEIVTRLCPRTCRDRQTSVPVTRRWRGLIGDLRGFTRGLYRTGGETARLAFSGEQSEVTPDIFNDWRKAVLKNDRQAPLDRFVAAIDAPTGKPPLYFLHAMVPHGPWTRLPDGRRIETPQPHPARLSRGWVDDPWLVDQAHQLHLLQVQYVDTFLGEVVERLEGLGIYDDTLLVVVSDHGAAFQPGGSRRGSSAQSVGDIPPIPLFIKAPRQAIGGIDDYRAHTTDIVPTVADLLGIDLTWATDGHSLVSPDRPHRTHSTITGDDAVIDFGIDGSEARRRAREKVARFGPGGPFGLAPHGHADLLGTELDTLRLAEPAAERATIENLARFDDIDTTADVLPVLLRVRQEGSDDRIVVGIVLNGEIVAVTRSYVDHRDDLTRFDALLPPDELRDGHNTLELVKVEGAGANRTFHRLDG